VINACTSLVEVYQELGMDLYNIAFATIWSSLDLSQRQTINNHLTRVLNYPKIEKIPLKISQTFLNLAEYMQHDQGLNIELNSLAEIAERC